MLQKKLLIVNYAFPPFPGIGGRRWAKFVKYLNTDGGFELHVLSAHNNTGKVSAWANDVLALKNLTLHNYHSQFPKEVLYYPKTIRDKLLYRYKNFLLKLKAKGNRYDRNVMDKAILQKNIRKIIKEHSIDAVIVSIAPNMAAYYVTLLKKEFPNVKFIIDYRDPWTDCNFELVYLSDRPSFDYEVGVEKIAIANADHIITVYETTTNTLKERFKEKADKMLTITNGFEESKDILQVKPKKDKNSLTLSFTGSMYIGVEHVFHPFIDALKRLKIERNDLYTKLNIIFCGDIAPHYIDYAKKNNVMDKIEFKGFISEKESREVVLNSDLCLLFLLRHYEFTSSTKFYDYINFDKKIFVASEPGYIPDLITSTNLGFWAKPETFYTDFVNALERSLNTNFLQLPTTLDKNEYNVKFISQKLITFLNTILKK